MLRISFVEEEFVELQKKVYFTPIQKRIMEYRLEEIVSVATIDREIKKIADKIKKVI